MVLLGVERVAGFRVGRYRCGCGRVVRAMARDVEAGRVLSCGQPGAMATGGARDVVAKVIGVRLGADQTEGG